MSEFDVFLNHSNLDSELGCCYLYFIVFYSYKDVFDVFLNHLYLNFRTGMLLRKFSLCF